MTGFDKLLNIKVTIPRDQEQTKFFKPMFYSFKDSDHSQGPRGKPSKRQFLDNVFEYRSDLCPHLIKSPKR